MESGFQIFLVLLAVLAGTALLARRLDIAPAILLLLVGSGLAFVPGMPAVELPPDLVLLVVLPPLIYSASVAMSWREFKSNLRPIVLLAVGCVIFTACAVATATHFLIGLPWNVGFLLGAIVAPPDVVAPLAIARRLRLPRRILVILEGEGLANDATTLILYRFAVVAISTSTFSFPKAAATFSAIVICELLFGLAIGWLSLRARKWARDPKIEITLSLITPYLAYLIPEHFGGSGVIATVVCGLYISWNGPLLISAATRMQGVFFWDLVIYLIEGLLFLLTGFQLRLLFEKSKAFPLGDIAIAVGLVAAIVIVARFAWVFPAAYLPRLWNRRLRDSDSAPPWRWIFVIAFTGVRGAVSLAAALALPLFLPNGDGFPYRDLILFVSFGVILVTFIGLGLGLPPVVRWLGVADHGHSETDHEREAEIIARIAALQAGRDALDEMKRNHELPPGVIGPLDDRHDNRAKHFHVVPNMSVQDDDTLIANYLRRQIFAERRHLHAMLREGNITDETRRRIERDLDLEEAMIDNREHATTAL